MGHKARQPNIIDVIVGANLRALRVSASLSQERVGELVGVTFQQIQKYERGTNRVGASRLWKFCEVFNIEPNVLYDGVGNLNDKKNGQDTMLVNFYQNPRGAAAAKAFIAIENPVLERQVIDLMKSFSNLNA